MTTHEASVQFGKFFLRLLFIPIVILWFLGFIPAMILSVITWIVTGKSFAEWYMLDAIEWYTDLI